MKYEKKKKKKEKKKRAALKDRNMQPLGLGSTRLLTGGAQKSPRTLGTNSGCCKQPPAR